MRPGDAVHDDADGRRRLLGGLRGGLLCHGVSCSSRERVARVRRAAAGKRLPECRTRRADRATPRSRGTGISGTDAAPVRVLSWAGRGGTAGTSARRADRMRVRQRVGRDILYRCTMRGADGADVPAEQGRVGWIGRLCRNFGAARRSDAACARRVGRDFLHPCITRSAVDGAGVPAGRVGSAGSGCSAGTSARRAGRMPRAPGASAGLPASLHHAGQSECWPHAGGCHGVLPAGRMPRACRGRLPCACRRGHAVRRANDDERAGGVSRGAAWTRAARPRCARRPRSRHPRRRARAAARGARAPRGGRAPW